MSLLEADLQGRSFVGGPAEEGLHILQGSIYNQVFTPGENPGINLIVSGGEFKAPTLSLTGDMAAQAFKSVHVGKCFLATAGISSDMLLTYPSLSDLVVKSAMIRAAEKVYLLADSSKLGYSSFASLGRINLIDTLITDSKLPEDKLQMLKDMKIEVL